MPNNSTPLISALTVTYGRPNLLEEAIQCFLDQDYPNKELIIINDQENVELILKNDNPDIRIYNMYKRFKSLGEKRNESFLYADGDYICIWDDDDLYTPWRMSESLKYIQNSDADIVKASEAFFSVNNSGYQITRNLYHSQAIITREWMKRKKYESISVGEDIKFEEGAKILNVDVMPLLWYVYRWGNNIHHLSGIADSQKSWEKSLTFDNYNVLNGQLILQPKFRQNYWEDIGNFLGTVNKTYKESWDKKIHENNR